MDIDADTGAAMTAGAASAQPRAIRMPLMRLPEFRSLSATARANLERLDALSGETCPGDVRALRAWLRGGGGPGTGGGPDPAFSALEHRLADVFCWSAGEAQRAGQSLSEMRVLEASGLSASDPTHWRLEDFERRLLALSGAAGGVGAFRRAAMQCVPDAGGAFTVFPPPHAARGQLARLFELLCSPQPAAFRAMVLMAALLNAHPLCDGNGRTSRMLFNWILAPRNQSRWYLPLYELNWQTRGSYVLCLKEAQLFGEWEALAAFLADAAGHLLAQLRSSPGPTACDRSPR